MIYGTFDSSKGVYGFEVNGRWDYFKPHYYANAMRHGVLDIYNTCIRGVDEMQKGFPNGIFVTDKKRWEERVAPHYPGLYAQSQLHYYDASVQAGAVPNWVLPWEQSAYRFIHEYSPGKIVLVRPMANYANDILMFFEPTDKPKPPSTGGGTGTSPAEQPPLVVPSIPSVITINLHVWHHAGEE